MEPIIKYCADCGNNTGRRGCVECVKCINVYIASNGNKLGNYKKIKGTPVEQYLPAIKI